MSKLALQMPVKELQRKYADALSVKKKVEIEIPAIMRDDTGIFLGHAELKDEKYQYICLLVILITFTGGTYL